MINVLPHIGALLGGLVGFIGGVFVLAFITRGHKITELLRDKDKKVWLGLFGWFFAAVGAYCGWHLLSILTE